MKAFILSLFSMLLLQLGVQAQEASLQSTADTYVSKSASDANYGSEPELLIKGSTNGNFDRKAFLKFDLSGSTSAYAQILIRVVKNDGEDADVVAKSTSALWEEQEMVWNNAPEAGEAISQGSLRSGDTLFIDVTDYIKAQIDGGQATASFELSTQDIIGQPFSVHSRESDLEANAPALIFYDEPKIEVIEDIQLSNYISSNMIIQRSKPFPFRGKGPVGAEVEVDFEREGVHITQTGTVGPNGDFEVIIPAMEATTVPSTVTIQVVQVSETKITLDNILIGDVWFAGGQSNMEKKVDYMLEADQMIQEADNYPNIRAFRAEYNSVFEPVDEVKPGNASWIVADSDNVEKVSAVAYSFAKKIYMETGVPIGLMQAYIGGTEIETWISEEKIGNDPNLQMVEDRIPGIDQDAEKFYQKYPSVNYNGMISPLRFFPIKGFLFYQGESNVKRAPEYSLLLTAIVEDWREKWNQEELPFYYVQLFNIGIAEDRNYEETPDDNTWQMLREQQLSVLEDAALSNIGMVVTIDTNEERLNPDAMTRIHPRNKKPVGDRLARLALKEQYGKQILAYSPLVDSTWVEDNKVFVKMKNEGDGLKIREGATNLEGFALAGEDGEYHKGVATIESPQLISVTSAEVSKPFAIAYGWSRDPLATLDNSVNLPASPFKIKLQETPATGDIRILSPIDDTYADGGSPSEIFGETKPQQMWVKTGSTDAFTRMGFIKFDISGLALEDVGTATLRLFSYDSQGSEIPISIFKIDENWDEEILSWENRPSFVYPAIRSKKVTEGEYVEWTITQLVENAIANGETTISLGLSDENGESKLVRFYTKEADNENKPQLEINKIEKGYQVFAPIDDAMVRGGDHADVNYSSGDELTELMVKSGSSSETFVRKSILKFDLSQVDPEKLSEIGTARLKLHFFKTNTSSPAIDISLLPVENSWEEETVTWNTFPQLLSSSALRTIEISPAEMDKYYEWDISSYVMEELAKPNTDSIVSIAVMDLAGVNNGATFYSKEADSGFSPILELLEVSTTVPPEGNAMSGTFYVDTENGDDANSGLTLETPWKSLDKINESIFSPGAQILFKAGQEWTGTLKLQGSGEEGSPIIVGRYGQGPKPAIHGAGAPETIHLENIEYIEIRNLEVTNYDPAEEGGISMQEWENNNITEWFEVPEIGNDETPNTAKIGIRLTAQDLGEVNHIHFINLDVHGINGDNDSKDNGGIFIEILGNLVPTYFNDLLVEGCHIHDVDRTGLSNVSTWRDRTFTENINWEPSLNYNVRNNIFERTGANALIVRVAKDPLIEHNLFHQCGIKGSGNAAFNFNTDGALFQYNEARFTKANVGDEDAGGLDSDFRTKNTILQYNYVHDNDYGMLATGGGFEGTFNDGTIFRYNIIERDGLVARENGEKYAFKISGQITNTTFHNNVMYLGPDQQDVDIMFHKLWRKNPENTYYYNNIYYLQGEDHGYDLRNSSGNEFSNNIYFANESVNLPPDSEALLADPLFVDPGNGPDGYKLQENSPAIGAGKLLQELPEEDYFGNLLPEEGPLDIGVHQYTKNGEVNTPGGFEKDNFDIYLLIGQSNMAGRGEIGELDREPLEDAYLFDGTNWENAEVPLNRYSTVRKDLDLQKMNPGYSFARKLTEYTGKGIGLVVNARGGTSIEQWQKGYDGSNDLDLYEEAVARLLEAKNDGNFKGILWHQGESNQSSSSTYMEKLKKLVSDLRADLGDAFFVAGELGKWRDSSEPMNAEIQGIANHINRASYVSSDGLAPINNDLDDPHFDGFSQRVLGGLYADEILQHVYNLPTGIASLFSECGYEGYEVNVKEGTYSLDELEKRGLRDNDLSALKLDTGYEARLYTNEGAQSSFLIGENTDCLDSTPVVNDVSYVIIGKIGTTNMGSIAMVKKAELLSEGCANAGDEVQFTFEVHNTGNVPLTDVAITDPLFEDSDYELVSGDENGDGMLDEDEVWSYRKTYNLKQEDIDLGNLENQASVIALDPEQNEVTDLSGTTIDQNDSTIIEICQNKLIMLEKTGMLDDLNNNGTAEVGETVTYSFTIKNVGNVTLYDIEVLDPLEGIAMEGELIPELLPGDSNNSNFEAVYTLTNSDIENEMLSNQAEVFAMDIDGEMVTDLSDDPNDPTDIDNNGNGNPDDPTILKLAISTEIEIYNGITPNGDGRNDFFYIKGISKHPGNNLKIFNRWGDKVYDMDGYEEVPNGKVFEGYSDGKNTIKRGERLPSGNYFYILSLGETGNGKKYSGNLYLNL